MLVTVVAVSNSTSLSCANPVFWALKFDVLLYMASNPASTVRSCFSAKV